MSRTDVHTPAWVKERDPAWSKNYREAHNHSWHVIGNEKVVGEDGRISYKSIWVRVERCDLDVYLAAKEWTRTACQIEYTHTGRNIHCGCNMCTGQVARRLDRRSERQRAKRLIKAGRWEDTTYVNRSHLSW